MTRIAQADSAVAAVRAMFADAASLAELADHEITTLLGQVGELARLVQAQQVRLAGAVDARTEGAQEAGLCRKLGKRSAKEAVASAFGIRVREAAELLSMARATTACVSISGGEIPTRYPQVEASLDAGELSLSQARAIVTTLETASGNADLELLGWAERCLVEAATDPERPLVPELLVEQARAYVAVLDPDGVLPAGERQRAMRSLRQWQRADGMWHTLMISPPEDGSAVKALLDAHMAPRAQVRFRDDDPAAAGAGAGAGAGGEPVAPDDRSSEQRRHDVMLGLLQAQASSPGNPIAGGEVPRLVFTVQHDAYEAYRRGDHHADRTLTIEHTRNPVPIETIDRLLCDALVQRAVVDAAGEVLELGRTERLFSRAQRRALARQYGGCASCRAPVAWTEAHHVRWWQHGGETDVRNGILLCNHCHHEVHAGRLVVVGAPGGWRVVPQLRPADPRARATRPRPTGPAPGIGEIARAAVELGASAVAMRGAAPVDAERGAAPVETERRAAPVDAERGAAPVDAMRGTAPLDAERGAAPVDVEREPRVRAGGRAVPLAADCAPSLAFRIASPRWPFAARPAQRTVGPIEASARRRLRACERDGLRAPTVEHWPAVRFVARP